MNFVQQPSSPLSKIAASALACAAAACGSSDPTPRPFTLEFMAMLKNQPVTCTATVTGLGPSGRYSVGVGDLRFYVSNVRFDDAAGNQVAHTLDENEFQLKDASGEVALIDLTGNTEGSCANSAIAFAEGTARTNTALKGTTIVENVRSVSFEIGVPQPLMKAMIAAHTIENVPSPLNEMYWSWASGYRHFVFNFAVTDDANMSGGGYIHVGSRDCGPPDGKALADRESCAFVNTAKATVSNLDLATDMIMVDLDPVLENLDFVAPIYDPMTFEVIGQGVGAECHSSPMQPDCPTVFGSFGIDIANGASNASGNRVFMLHP